jgi:hypothetical protein
MRTTVDLPDHLFRAAKAEAAARGETLKELLTRALTNELGTAVAPRQPGRRVQLPLIKGTSGRKINLTNVQIEQILAEEEAEHHHGKYLRGSA